MLDQVSLKIEQLAFEHGSYIDAMVIFLEEFKMHDFEDVLEVLHPNLVAKIRQEFIDKNYFPNMKQRTIMDFMKD